jgi:hypothetical protein
MDTLSKTLKRAIIRGGDKLDIPLMYPGQEDNTLEEVVVRYDSAFQTENEVRNGPVTVREWPATRGGSSGTLATVGDVFDGLRPRTAKHPLVIQVMELYYKNEKRSNDFTWKRLMQTATSLESQYPALYLT